MEFDVHPTKDGQFAVFHDWTLECRTDVEGVTRDHTMEELKQLDIGYGYTADGGKTYPFRGKGVGLMPTLDEVLVAFPKQSFLIHIKSDDPLEFLGYRGSRINLSTAWTIQIHGSSWWQVTEGSLKGLIRRRI